MVFAKKRERKTKAGLHDEAGIYEKTGKDTIEIGSNTFIRIAIKSVTIKTRKSMNILIIGANFSNKGAEAMMLTVRQQLELRHKQARFYMLCRGYEEALAEENSIVPVCNQDGELKKKIKKIYKKASGKMHKFIFKEDKPFVFEFPFAVLKTKIPDIDMVVDVSGFAYADSWGEPMVMETIKLQRLYKKEKTRFYFMPQAWGSFHKPRVANAVKEMLANANKFYARDLTSQKYLSDVLDTPPKKIPLMHDIVFAYDTNGVNNNVLSSLGYKRKGDRVIGISPNLRVYERTSGLEKDNVYFKMLLALANHCIQALNADVIFIPNEVFPPNVQAKDDRYLCRLLMKFVEVPERCFFADQYYSAIEIDTIIGSVDILISSRFHALIFGFLHEKPVMAISWSHKYKELFSLFDLEDFVLESNDMEQDDAIRLLSRLVTEKESIEKKIKTSLPGLKIKAREMFDEIALDR
jgi:colanic acid/amylovoran biosynthesis protein